MSQVTTPRGQFRKLYTTNSTASSITAPIPTTTEPTGDGYFRCGATGDEGNFNYVDLMFIAAGADNVTAKVLVVGWRRAVDPLGVALPLWIPRKLVALDLTFGTQIGIASAVAIATDRFADTITLTSGGGYTTAYEIVGPGTPDNSIASVKIDPIGCDFIQVLTTLNSSATNVNALAAGY